jgi:hypothetical protein
MIEMTNKKYLIGKIVPKSNRKMVETEIKMIPPIFNEMMMNMFWCFQNVYMTIIDVK